MKPLPENAVHPEKLERWRVWLVEWKKATGRPRIEYDASVEAAKADGTWTSLDAVERLDVPVDLAAALSARPPAAELWEAFPRSVKRGILEWIQTAKRPATRAARIDETVRLAALDERANQWTGPKRTG
jgi:uncharacterized protein YdeI (YjbR/CyaY-like superfamily)